MTMNFTQPYDPLQGGERQDRNNPDAPLSDDRSKEWDPTGGPDGQGAWVPVGTHGVHEQKRTFDKQQWGGRGQDIDANGNPIDGSSGAERDVTRYEGMAGPAHANGPIIDRSRGNEARGIGQGGLDLMRQTAEGNSPSVAEKLGTAQGQGAQAARFGIASSVRGGAAARAAAARGAQSDAGTIGQQTLASNAATRAGEMATARGAYFGGASGQRGSDLGVATEQSNLEMGQRGANDSREQFYENKAHDVKKSQLGAQLGRTASEQAAADVQRQADQAAAARAQDRSQQQTNTILQGAQGGLNAYANSQQDSGTKPDPNSTSDEKAKKNVRPVSDRVARRIKEKARGMIEDTDAQAEGFGLRKGKSEDSFSDDPDGKPGDPLNGYIARSGVKGPTYGGPKKGILTNADTGNLGGFKREVGGDGQDERDRNAAAEARMASANRKEHGLDDTSERQKPSRLISDLEAAKLKKQAESMQANLQAQREGFGMSTTNTPGNESAGRGEVESPRARVKARMGDIVRDDPYDDKPKATWGTGERAGGSDELHEAMLQSVEKDKGPPDRKMNPENPYTNSLFGHAEPGYAKSRAGKPGAMFDQAGAPSDMAPGTEDFYKVKKFGKRQDLYSRQIMGEEINPGFQEAGKADIMYSDQRAKQDAFKAGAEWSLNNGEGGVPAYMPGTVNSQGGAKRADSPVHGKDNTREAGIEEYPTDPSKRSPEDRAKVAQLHQFVNDNEGDAFDRANTPGQGPPAEPLNPRDGTPDQGVPRTSVANDMRKRARDYPTQQDRDETPEQRTARFLKKSQTPRSSPSTTSNEGETPDERTQRFLKKSQDKSRPSAPASYDTSGKVGSRASDGGTGKRPLPGFVKEAIKPRKIPGPIGEALDNAGKRLTGQPTTSDEQNAEQDRQIHSNQMLTDKLQNIQSHSELSALRKKMEEQGLTTSDERAKNVRFGGPMAAANRSMEPKVYEYKDGFAQKEGQELGDVNVGPIAQKMKKDPVAATVIVDDPESGMLGIDKAKGLKLVMGGLADLQRQVDGLSGKKKEKK